MKIKTAFGYIISNTFNFYCVFEGYVSQRDWSSNNVNRIAATPGLLEKRLWRHNFCPRSLQQDFIT